MTARFAAPTPDATPIHVLPAETAEAFAAALPAPARAQLQVQPFAGKLGEVRLLFSPGGGLEMVLAGWGTAAERARQQFPLGNLAGALPAGTYALDDAPDGPDRTRLALAWLLSAYRFDRYADRPAQEAALVAPAGVDAARLEQEAAGVALACDLINTPANDMGPDELEAAARALAEAEGAAVSVIRGDALLERNFPMIHAVGRASDKAPRLIDIAWGAADAPAVTLVGKGVCFDTGGLNIKPGASMGLMKKDMGGAATVLGLAQMIMRLKLRLRLRVLIPAVENSISAGAFRPGDVLTARNGLTVEINNTDAEGRLVLADALALAAEEAPALLVSMATLTGAARVALGPDVPPLYTDDEALAAELAAAAATRADPLWRMPFFDPYEEMIEPEIADLDNAPRGGFAGSITAALFLRRFVDGAGAYAHFDVYGWTPAAKPARPRGGACQGARALLEVLAARHGGGAAR
ncbi:leucyl aminopeptidase family protein [Rhodobacteraceae bacterium 2CG4]|uniref:Leucyl aminopeptidase family protein n=1 Tax=Halovulum marinum TaxID=2662447 RepID=A0A6L5YYW3_9RHOB|nr:leucyl aminopeptidase family protein [Halovulum marinum]MSU89476.1 leucyl aminopeptidase family protein [Halovulum marinum]